MRGAAYKLHYAFLNTVYLNYTTSSIMNYEETLVYLYAQLPEYQRVGEKAYKEGLDNSLALDKYFNHPHTRFKTIHVGGTNGKGSTSHLLASVLQTAGYKVGLYTSPHLVDFRERIRVNGEMIDKDFIVDFVEKHRETFEPICPSFFELSMEMAFLYFAEQKVDIAIIEVGLGGRLDSTNIISPILSIITNIGLDHVKFLGDTLPKIAREKAGIIKPSTPVVIGEADDAEIKNVFVETAEKMHAPIIFADKNEEIGKIEKVAEGWKIAGGEFDGVINPLGGFAQQKNTKTVLTAIQQLNRRGYHISKEIVAKGFANVVNLTHLAGRWQILGENPKIVTDTGHNSHGIKYIVEQLSQEKYDKLHIVFGMVNDKDISKVLGMMPQNATYYFTKASIERALPEKDLKMLANTFGLDGNTYPTVKEAVEAAQKNADEKDFIFIGGSSFIVADALPLFI